MAEISPPFAFAGDTAETIRQFIQSLCGNTQGIVGLPAAGGLAVTANGSTLVVTIAAGACFIDGTVTGDQGFYHGFVDAAVTRTLATGDASHPRIDVIVARVQDQAYGESNFPFKIDVIQGTPATTPLVPTIPDNCLQLAQIAVAANANHVSQSNVTDKRVGCGLVTVNTLLSQLTTLGLQKPAALVFMVPISVAGLSSTTFANFVSALNKVTPSYPYQMVAELLGTAGVSQTGNFYAQILDQFGADISNASGIADPLVSIAASSFGTIAAFGSKSYAAGQTAGVTVNYQIPSGGTANFNGALRITISAT